MVVSTETSTEWLVCVCVRLRFGMTPAYRAHARRRGARPPVSWTSCALQVVDYSHAHAVSSPSHRSRLDHPRPVLCRAQRAPGGSRSRHSAESGSAPRPGGSGPLLRGSRRLPGGGRSEAPSRHSRHRAGAGLDRPDPVRLPGRGGNVWLHHGVRAVLASGIMVLWYLGWMRKWASARQPRRRA